MVCSWGHGVWFDVELITGAGGGGAAAARPSHISEVYINDFWSRQRRARPDKVLTPTPDRQTP